MAAGAKSTQAVFDPAAFRSFRFLARELGADGRVSLSYALDEELVFTERLDAARPGARSAGTRSPARRACSRSCTGWPASATSRRRCRPRSSSTAAPPGPAAAALLEALYSEGLGELAFTNRLPALPRPRFARRPRSGRPALRAARRLSRGACSSPSAAARTRRSRSRSLRRSGAETALFSVGDAPPIARTAAAAGLPRLIASARAGPAAVRAATRPARSTATCRSRRSSPASRC